MFHQHRPTLRSRPALLLLTLLTAAVFGCGKRPPPANTMNQAAPERVVSLAPNLTEIIFRLGEGNRIVGVSKFCKYPAEALGKPKVGALVDVDYEKLRVLDPDLVVMLASQNEIANRIKRLGLQVQSIEIETIENIYSAIDWLGGLLRAEEKSEQLVAELKDEMAALRAEMDGDSNRTRPRVLIVVGRNPGTLQQIYACGSGNYLNELLKAVGGENVLGETTVPWPVISKEAIIKHNPDVIIDGSVRQGETPDDGDFHMQAWNQMDMLGAVKSGRLVALADDHHLVIGPGFIEGARFLLDAIQDGRPPHRPE